MLFVVEVVSFFVKKEQAKTQKRHKLIKDFEDEVEAVGLPVGVLGDEGVGDTFHLASQRGTMLDPPILHLKNEGHVQHYSKNPLRIIKFHFFSSGNKG